MSELNLRFYQPARIVIVDIDCERWFSDTAILVPLCIDLTARGGLPNKVGAYTCRKDGFGYTNYERTGKGTEQRSKIVGHLAESSTALNVNRRDLGLSMLFEDETGTVLLHVGDSLISRTLLEVAEHISERKINGRRIIDGVVCHGVAADSPAAERGYVGGAGT